MPDPGSIAEAKFVRSGNVELNMQPMLQVLRSYCLGMLKACGYINQQIKFEHYYEVSPQLFHPCPSKPSS